MHVNFRQLLLHAKTPKILAGVLACILLLAWGMGVRDMRRLERITEPHDVPVVKAQTPLKTATQHEALKATFFGEYVPYAVGDAGVERSRLNASIVGILYSSDEQASQVLIDVPGHADKLFRTGDRLPGGALIKRITPEGVLLLRGGVIESLSLPKKELIFTPPPPPM